MMATHRFLPEGLLIPQSNRLKHGPVVSCFNSLREGQLRVISANPRKGTTESRVSSPLGLFRQ